MSAGGEKVVARWREAGRWWDGEPYREVSRVLLPTGKVKEVIQEFPCLGDPILKAKPEPHVEDHREDLDFRYGKVRDEKIKLALGLVPDRTYPDLSKPTSPPYALLHAVSGYAFGRGSMLADEIPVIAAARGATSALIADPLSLAGAVQFSKSAAAVGIKALIGTTMVLPEGGELVLVAKNNVGYRSLCRLITECHQGEPRLFPLSSWERLERHKEGVLCLTGGNVGRLTRLALKGRGYEAKDFLNRLVSLYGRQNVVVQIERSHLPWGEGINERLLHIAAEMQLLACAGGITTHAQRSHFPAQDVIACIHSLCSIEDVQGRKPTRHKDQPQAKDTPARSINAEQYVRSAAAMAKLYADRPYLITNTHLVANMCDDVVLPGRTSLPTLYPNEPAMLAEATYAGAVRLYPKIYKGIARRLERELRVIAERGYAGHFLLAYEMCDWATSVGIQLSGRGSVVDSLVAYCLGMSRIDAYKHNLSFERFLPLDGSKRPDIDIDFEANRRNEVRDYLVRRFKAENVATVGAYGAFNTRGIVSGIGKVMGLPEATIKDLTEKLHGGVSPAALEDALSKRPELRDSGISVERFRWVFKLAERLTDVPRNMRAHPCGVVVSSEPICDISPVVRSAVEGVNVIQYDKGSAKPFWDKFDVLCLRALDILGYTQERVRTKDTRFSASTVPTDDPETFRTMRAGDLIGITQSASPAMTAAHVRVRTNSLPDAALVQACIRPGVGGAIKNDLLVARKHGEAWTVEHPLMRRVLGKTYGVVVFQEQVDQLLVEFAGYTTGEAEEIREGMYKRRRENYIQSVEEEIKTRIVDNGFGVHMAQSIYDMVSPYTGYGFAEGHALAFAETTIRSLWCKINHPAEFFAAALEAQPAGYYPSHTLANEARNKGVLMLPPSINRSGLSYTVEDVQALDDPKLVVPNGGVRVPLTRIMGVSANLCERTMIERRNGPYTSLAEYALRAQPEEDELQQLILCGAFDELHPNRRATLWGISDALQYGRSYSGMEGALPFSIPPPVPPTDVSDFLPSERALIERKLLGLDVEHHLMGFERQRVSAKGVLTTRDAKSLGPGDKAMVVGNPMRLRMPPTKSGRRVVFFDIEDEFGILNVTVFDETYLRDGHALVTQPYVLVWVTAQDRMGHKAFLASSIVPYKPTFSGEPLRGVAIPLVTADFLHC